MIVSTIGTGGGRDYSTLVAWESAMGTTLTDSHEGDIYDDGTPPSAVFNMSFAMAGYNVTLKPASGQEWRNQIGANRLDYWSTGKGAAITSSPNNADAINIAPTGTGNITIQDLMFLNTGGTNVQSLIEIRKQVTLDRCILRGDVGTNVLHLRGGHGGSLIKNCFIIVNLPGMQGIHVDAAGTSTIDSCTVMVPTGVTNTVEGIYSRLTSTVIHSVNNAVFGFGDNFRTAFGGTMTGDYNGFDGTDAQAPGSNNKASITFSQTEPFVDAATATLDLRLKAASALSLSGGTDLTTDAFNTSRPQGAQDDIGAHELIVAAASGIMINRVGRGGLVGRGGYVGRKLAA